MVIRKKDLLYLCILKHLLQALLHVLEFTRLDTAIGQQHSAKLPLTDSAISRIVPFKLEVEKHRQMTTKC